jgi:signal transduction histidine kinase
MNLDARSGSVVFRPRARLLKLIGEELISDEIVAVTELVKNAHDADASTVTIEFCGVTKPDGQIIIRDDGTGMSLETLLRHWMEPAGTSKVVGQRRTRLGRRVLGEKGVGRFAADKLGSRLELVSRCAGDRDEIHAFFDWELFESDATMLSDVKNRWEKRKPVDNTATRGTSLHITGLRSSWNERMFRRLATRLSRLRPPARSTDGFVIRIESDEFPHYTGELRSDLLERAPYRIDATFDGQRTIKVQMNRGKVFEQVWNGTGDLRCGPIKVRLFAYDLETEALAKIGPRAEVRAWLREWSGISVYRDGFRVWPYGEPHDDWLRLDQRRVNNPTVKLSNNQVVGFVDISGDGNPELLDQTNREGLIHNDPFEDLRRLLHFSLQLLEAQRQTVRHPRNSLPQSEPKRPVRAGPEQATLSLDRLAEKAGPGISGELKRVAKKLNEERAAREDEVLRMLNGYAELAAIGHAATGISRTIDPLVRELRDQCGLLRTAMNGSATKQFARPLRALEEGIGSIVERLAMLVPIDAAMASQRRRAIDVVAELQASSLSLRPILEERQVEVKISGPSVGVTRTDMRPENFHRLVYILVTNSLDWLAQVKKPEIGVSVRGNGDWCEILFTDNGPGIPAAVAEVAFEPLFSGKEGGRGMGLAVAKNIVTVHGGTIEVITDARRRGANILLRLPRKKARSTMHLQ